MATEKPVPIALLHNGKLARLGLERLLSELPGYTLVHHAATPGELKRGILVKSRTPALLVLGLSVAMDQEYQLLRWCRQHLPTCRLLVLGPEPDPWVLMSLVATGVQGFCCEERCAEQLPQLLELLLCGGLHFPPALQAQLMRTLPVVRTAVSLDKRPSKRQVELLTIIARRDNPSYQQAAHEMRISLNRVHRIRGILFHRYHLKDKRDLVLFAVQLGHG